MKLPTWPRASTRAFIREARRTPGYSLFDLLHGYVYARWPYLYIGIGTGEHPLARAAKPIIDWLNRRAEAGSANAGAAALPSPRRGGAGGGVSEPGGGGVSEPGEGGVSEPGGGGVSEPGGGGVSEPGGGGVSEPGEGGIPDPGGGGVTFADTYHGKVVTLEAATRLVRVERDVDLGDLEHIIPYALARDIVLQHPDHIVALDCPCRAARGHPCLPLDVCLIVGEPFASFTTEHHPRRSRRITADEAAAILQAEHDRGHVHHAFFKDAMLGRFYAICNCCSCCCGALQAQRNGVPMLAASGYVCRSDPDRCIGCGACVDYCQFGALALNDGCAVVDFDKCMGCGVCVDQCGQGGLSLVRDESKGIPLEINALMAAALEGSIR